MKIPDLIDISQVEREITQAFNDLIEEIEELYQSTYHNWDNKPEFFTTIQLGKDKTVEYSTEDENYVRIDDGTPAHDIQGNPFLKFKTPSTPKTQSKRLTSFAGFEGRNWNTKEKVRHPGIEARLFSEEIAHKIDKLIEEHFDKAMIRINSL